MKIVLAEKVSPATLSILNAEPGWTCITADKIANLADELKDADALIVRSAVQANEELLSHARQLRVIGRAGVGVDNIDTAAATKNGIVVMNTPGANAVAVAELTLGLMISMCRQIPRANASMHAGTWDKKSLQGTELRGKTLGVVGLGRIGLEVAKRAAAFGMELIAYDPFIAPVIAREHGVTLTSLDQVFNSSDFLTLHVGLTTQTEGMINAHSIAIMKPGIRIINCARGELIVDQALADALKAGKVAGAALDVFTKEPLKESPYHGLPNVLLSPHIAGATDEAQEAIGIQLARQVRDYLKLGVVQNAVNLPSLTHEEYLEVGPYIDMASRLGAFLAHSAPGNLESVAITYTGRLATGKTDLIRNAAVAGIFADTEGGNSVNRINAAAIAEERGIRIQEDKKEFTPGGTGSTLRLVLHYAVPGSAQSNAETRGCDTSASATVLHETSPRLLSYDGIDIEAPLTGTLIAIRNHDVPGVVGRIGTILGEHQINIANFALGRALSNKSQRVPQGQALAILQIDVPDAATAAPAITALKQLEAIASARLIELPL